MARLNRKEIMSASHTVDRVVTMCNLLALHGWNMAERRGLWI